MSLLKSLLLAYLNAGRKKSYTDEVNQQIFILHLFALIGTSITSVTAIIAYSNNNTRLSIVLFIVCFIFTLGPIAQKLINNYRLSSSIILYQLYFLMFYLIYSGGVSNTGPLWIFLTAPVTFFICGLTHGILNLLIFIIVVSTILVLPTNTLSGIDYPLDFKIRLIASFITVSALSALYEYSRDISYKSMKDVRDKFEKLSKLDPLTQLSNRRDATNIMEYEQRRLVRNNTKLSIIICDIDNFKKINDNYGHDVGDLVLIELAKVFKRCVRAQDTVARWGGEEFLFILPYTNQKQALLTAQKIHIAINEKIPFCEGYSFNITVSMGISTLVDHASIESTISLADNNLYKAKKSGKNRTYADNEELIVNG